MWLCSKRARYTARNETDGTCNTVGKTKDDEDETRKDTRVIVDTVWQ